MRLLSILQQAFWPDYIISEPDFDTHPRCKSSKAVSICRTPGQQRACRAAEPPSSLLRFGFGEFTTCPKIAHAITPEPNSEARHNSIHTRFTQHNSLKSAFLGIRNSDPKKSHFVILLQR